MTFATSRSPAGSPIRILVVDDDPIFRSLIVSRARSLYAEVLEADDGNAAWRLTADQAFDLAIVDFDMPNFNGLELIQCLRGHPRTRHMAIVMCTSRTDQHTMNEAIKAGASSFLTKPVNWPLFERHIGHLLELSSQAAQSRVAVERLEAASAGKDALVASLLRDLGTHLPVLRQASVPGAIATDALESSARAAEAALVAFAMAYQRAGGDELTARTLSAQASVANTRKPMPDPTGAAAVPVEVQRAPPRRLPLPPRL